MSNESRAAFEAWWEEFTAEHDEWQYADSAALRLAAWQASRKVALDEAIQVAGPEDSYQDEHFAAKADSVRRIKELMK